MHPSDLPDTEVWRYVEFVNVANQQDSTPFSKQGFIVSSSYLLSLGADSELENDCGEKPADLIDTDNKELQELFGLAVND